MSAKDPPLVRPPITHRITRRFPTCDHYSDGTIRMHCGCRDEPFTECVSLKNAQPMPERSDFTDNCRYLRHYCEKHWNERNGLPEDAPTTPE